MHTETDQDESKHEEPFDEETNTNEKLKESTEDLEIKPPEIINKKHEVDPSDSDELEIVGVDGNHSPEIDDKPISERMQ